MSAWHAARRRPAPSRRPAVHLVVAPDARVERAAVALADLDAGAPWADLTGEERDHYWRLAIAALAAAEGRHRRR